ncbi:OmpA family protein [candidate division WOR-3 bacterium]|uniref:OmpA family protein n=1 Tax=candidate division WOR-3 bacterium TaxID=2052148 RepID=A0A9D5K878_UNCW3|nr:OmpA family protein [candidate division WOR-3 bacterium]MBD3364088.1 OmpA family protein [candidate division WOR-3 bacterium]
MGKKIILGLAGLSLILSAEFNRSSVLIDAPTAYVLRHKVVQGTAVGSFGVSTNDPRAPYEFDFALGLGLGDFCELSVTAFTLENYSLGVSALLLKEKTWYPSIAVGIHDITWVPYIGSFGGGNTTPPGPNTGNFNPEDQIIDNPNFLHGEQKEWFSAFLVASKQFGNYLRVHAGLGRGRFVGYDRFEASLNSDVFFNTFSPNAIGLFGGLEFNYDNWLSVSLEYDGRDINAGTKIGFEYWEVYLAMNRLEQLGPNAPYAPRLVAGLNFYTSPHKRIRKGSVLGGKVTYPDANTAGGATVDLFSDTYNQTTKSNDRGNYRLRGVPAGELTLVAAKDGYRSNPEQIKITEGASVRVDLELKDIRNMGRIDGRVLDAVDGSGIVSNVYVVETGDVVRTGPKGGAYELVGLSPGKYTLHAEARGYFDHEITCQAKSGTETELDINMSKNWIIFHFKPGEKMIEQRYMPVLEDVVRFLKKRPNMIVEIQGHTDSVGDAKHNRELSRKRAEAVRDFLVKRGISESRLVVKGYGELSPIGDNRTILGRDMNRRVELKVLSE